MKRPIPHNQNDAKGDGGWRNQMADTCDSVIVMSNPVVRHGAYTDLQSCRHAPERDLPGRIPTTAGNTGF